MSKIHTTLIDESTNSEVYPTVDAQCFEGYLPGDKLEPASVGLDQLFPNSINDAYIRHKSLTANSIADGSLTLSLNDSHLYRYEIQLEKNNSTLLAIVVSNTYLPRGAITFDQFIQLIAYNFYQCALIGSNLMQINGNNCIVTYTNIDIVSNQLSYICNVVDLTAGTISKANFDVVNSGITDIKINSNIQIR